MLPTEKRNNYNLIKVWGKFLENILLLHRELHSFLKSLVNCSHTLDQEINELVKF